MEVVPGIKAKEVRTDAEEVAELRAKIASEQITRDEEKRRQIEAIRTDVVKRINENDGPIKITEEMVELGIAEEMAQLIQTACMAEPFRKLFRDDDDDDDLDAPGAWLGA